MRLTPTNPDLPDAEPTESPGASVPSATDADLKSLLDEVRFLRGETARLSERIDRMAIHRVFRGVTWARQTLARRKRRAGQILLKSPLHPLYVRILDLAGRRFAPAPGYRVWIAQTELLYPPLSWHRQVAAQWLRRPLVSVLLATYNPKREWLDRAIESVKAQSYAKWECCICDDGSGAPWLTEYLNGHAAADPRFKVARATANGGIASALTTARALAKGDLVTFLDHDDELHRHALHYIAEAFQDDAVDFVYTDEDHWDPDGQPVKPLLKPDWSPELLDSCMYLGHLIATRRDLFDRVGGFRPGFDGAQDYDLALRLTESAREIRHVPRVLYHWRMHPGSASMNPDAKPYAHAAGKRALQDSVSRRGIDAEVVDGPFRFVYQISRPVSRTRVSVVVCSRGGKLLSSFLKNVAVVQPENVEIVLVEHRTGEPAAFSILSEYPKVVRVAYEGSFNFADMCNRGVRASRSELLVFLNDDVKPKRPDWLGRMAANLEREDIGVVGARLVYPDGSLQHAGIAIGLLDGAGHPGRGYYASDLMYYLNLPRDVTAVTGACLGIRRSLFEHVGGFDTQFPVTYNDVDLCLRVRRLGFRVIVDPRIELTHRECSSRIGLTKFVERERFMRRWMAALQAEDSFYPRGFDRNTDQIRLCDAPTQSEASSERRSY